MSSNPFVKQIQHLHFSDHFDQILPDEFVNLSTLKTIKFGYYYNQPTRYIGQAVRRDECEHGLHSSIAEHAVHFVDEIAFGSATESGSEHASRSSTKWTACLRSSQGTGNDKPLVRITLNSGRQVVGTRAKSFLTRRDNKLVATNGSDLCIGDRLPVCRQFPNISPLLPHNTPLTNYNGCALTGNIGYLIGCYISFYYSSTTTNMSCLHQNNFDWLVMKVIGVTQNRTRRLQSCFITDDLNININTTTKIQHQGQIFSTTLRQWLYGESSSSATPRIHHQHPTIPAFAYVANTEFIIGIIDGLFDDPCACIKMPDNSIQRILYRVGTSTEITNANNDNDDDNDVIVVSCAQKHLVATAITLLLSCVDIYCTKVSLQSSTPSTNEVIDEHAIHANDGNGDGGCPQTGFGQTVFGQHVFADICVHGNNLVRLVSLLSSYSPCELVSEWVTTLRNSDQWILSFWRPEDNNISTKQNYIQYDEDDVIPGINLYENDQMDEISYHRNKLPNMITHCKSIAHTKLLRCAYDNDVIFERIISIEMCDLMDLQSVSEYVYDLTVADTRTFMLYSGINVYDTFHMAGVSAANVTLGVPRFRELLNLTKKQKTSIMHIRLNGHDKMSLHDIRVKSRATFEYHSLQDFIESHTIMQNCFHTLSNEDRVWYTFFTDFIQPDFLQHANAANASNGYSLRIFLKKDMMYNYLFTTEQVAQRIEHAFRDTFCVYSPTHVGIIDIYFDTSKVLPPIQVLERMKKHSRRKKTNELQNLCTKLLITQDNKDFYFLRDIALPHISKVRMCGIPQIEKIFFYQVAMGKGVKEWVIETQGSNFLEVLSHIDVDVRTTMTNNVWEIYDVLGIEAARKFLITEFIKTMSFGGSSINNNHYELLSDSMTFSSKLSSVSRYGIDRSYTGPFAKASFEQTLDNFLIAGYQGEEEDVSCVSASIILGQMMRLGSGMSDLFLNYKMATTPLPAPLNGIDNIVDDGGHMVFDDEDDVNVNGNGNEAGTERINLLTINEIEEQNKEKNITENDSLHMIFDDDD